MRGVRAIAVALVLAAMTGAGVSAQVAPAPLPPDARPPAFSIKDCLLAGGRIVTWPITGGRSCNLPTGDGGRACRTGADCESHCMAETQTCHPWHSLGPGCHDLIEDDGRAVTLCLD